ncbi:endonuclease/exonuclease/phosphatase family protein [Actinoplanes sp. NPDC051494]|uniref:endonuclease/exonuclease/phosphatase family protein n=1 Tax=Actinoplanes sp. NPDC051494 TaxID=3363907 RepID=UPI003790301A
MKNRRWRIGSAVTAAVAVGVAGVLGLHSLVPGWLGTAIDSGLPWFGVVLPLLLGASVVRRSRWAFVVSLVPSILWTVMFGPVLVPRSGADHHDLRVATLNLGATNPEPRTALAAVAEADPDVLVLQELTVGNRAAAGLALDRTWIHHTVTGTVGIWSKVPLSDMSPVDIGIGWTRALRVTVPTQDGPLRIYVAHLASARPAATAERNQTVASLARTIAADESPRLLLAGDLNTTTTDRQFAAFEPLEDTQVEAGSGFGFTWPSKLPVMRPDHILQRGMSTQRSWVVEAPGSDHRAAFAELDTA